MKARTKKKGRTRNSTEACLRRIERWRRGLHNREEFEAGIERYLLDIRAEQMRLCGIAEYSPMETCSKTFECLQQEIDSAIVKIQVGMALIGKGAK